MTLVVHTCNPEIRPAGKLSDIHISALLATLLNASHCSNIVCVLARALPCFTANVALIILQLQASFLWHLLLLTTQ